MGETLDLARVGLTGGRGVLGRRLHEQLKMLGATTLPFEGDVRDPLAVDLFVREVDVVIHAAAVVPVTEVEARLGEAVSVNVAGSANIAHAVASRERRLVYISTSHVYEPSTSPLKETSPVAPSSLYGMSKLQGEMWCKQLGCDALFLRVFSFFDKRQNASFLVPALTQRIREAASGSVLLLPGASSLRDLADASWIAEGVSGLLDAQTGVVNCGTGQSISIMELAHLIAALLDREDLGFSAEVGAPEGNAIVADTRKLTALLPSLPAFDLRASLARYLDVC